MSNFVIDNKFNDSCVLCAGCSIVDGSSPDVIPLDSEPPSLVDEGLRIARQYGLGADFESELEGLKKATTAAAATVTQETAGMVEEMEDSTMSNHDDGMADQAAGMVETDPVQMTT